MKIYYHDAGHMTKMAATTIYGKKTFKNLLRNRLAETVDFSEIIAASDLKQMDLMKICKY